jgi:hypothetical protein
MASYILESLVRERIEAGRLPDHVPRKLLGTRGSAEPCAICSRLLRRSQMVFEVELPDGSSYMMHTACYDAWLEACEHPETKHSRQSAPTRRPS